MLQWRLKLSAVVLSSTFRDCALMRPDKVLPANRIQIIDITRGIAVLGIFVINVQDMAFPDSLAFYLYQGSSEPKLDKYIGLLFEIIFYGKMQGLFAVLFGVSSALIIDKLIHIEGGPSDVRLYFFRLLWLAVFGLVNAYALLWWGDVLFKYAVIGILLFPLRSLSIKSLLAVLLVGFTIIIAQSFLGYVEVVDLQERVADIRSKRQQGQPLSAEQEQIASDLRRIQMDLAPDFEFIDEEVEIKTGSYLRLFTYNAGQAFEEQTTIFLTEDFAQIFLYMTLGVALVRLKVFVGLGCRRRVFIFIAFFCLGVGVLVHAWLNLGLYASRLDPVSVRYFQMFFELGRLSFVLGYLGVIIIAFRMSILRSAGDCLAAVGRMALTNYLLHSIIGAAVFYGFGLMQFNRLARSEIVLVIALTWAFQIVGSVGWMTRFRYGPVEWLWRSLTYGKILPIRKR